MILAQGEYGEDCVSGTVCPGLCVLRFEYLAAPTRRTTVTAVGTGLPSHYLYQANWFYFLNPSISSLLCCVFVHIYLKTLTEHFLNFLSSISSVCLSSSCLSCVYALCTLCLFSFHHDDHACILLCLLLSTYSATSSSSLRNFLTSKFLSEEFIKIAYSPPLVDTTHFQAWSASLERQVEERRAVLASLRGMPAEEEEIRKREEVLALEAVEHSLKLE